MGRCERRQNWTADVLSDRLTAFFYTVCVGGLAEEVNEKLLHSAFIVFGDITDVSIPLDTQSGNTTATSCSISLPILQPECLQLERDRRIDES